MATFDLKEVYYSVKTDGDSMQFLICLCSSKLLKFDGLLRGPHKFTKLTKSPLAMIRMQGYTVAIYIDDIIAIDQSFEECLLVVAKTINLFQKLGFVIHLEKGNFITAKKIVTYLSEKTKKIQEMLYNSSETKISNKRIC